MRAGTPLPANVSRALTIANLFERGVLSEKSIPEAGRNLGTGRLLAKLTIESAVWC